MCAALVEAVTDLMPDIMAAAEQPATQEAQLKAGQHKLDLCVNVMLASCCSAMQLPTLCSVTQGIVYH